MHRFSNVSKNFILLQPLDASDVVPFPAGSDLDLNEKQAAANCRDLCAFIGAGRVRADDAATAYVVDALDAYRAKRAEAKAKADADRAARRG